MHVRTFWLNLGWLVMLVVTVAAAFALDAAGRLTYFTSLVLWGIPILYLFPIFTVITAAGTGRRRRALRLAGGTLVVPDIFCIPRRRGPRAGDLPVSSDRQFDQLAGVCSHHALRHRDVARVGGDARDPAAMVGIQRGGHGRRDDRRLVARRRDLSGRG